MKDLALEQARTQVLEALCVRYVVYDGEKDRLPLGFAEPMNLYNDLHQQTEGLCVYRFISKISLVED